MEGYRILLQLGVCDARLSGEAFHMSDDIAILLAQKARNLRRSSTIHSSMSEDIELHTLHTISDC
jgi:hypothetical protein